MRFDIALYRLSGDTLTVLGAKAQPVKSVQRTRLAALALLALVVLAGCSVQIDLGTNEEGESIAATVTGVVDGDTIDVRFANGTTDRVRLLGIDTPEVHVAVQPGEYEGVPDTEAGRACLRAAGENASTAVERRLAGEQVTIRLDPAADTRGSYGRLLGIVVHEDTSINHDLVESGHARLYDTEFTDRDRYAAAERDAMAAGRGLWACRSP